jgi:hypothetical protein
MTPEQRQKLVEIVNAGLVSGLGEPRPGSLCVEAAVCLALGEAHSDTPSCVAKRCAQVTTLEEAASAARAAAAAEAADEILIVAVQVALDAYAAEGRHQ